ncbi:MAG: DUF1599 domain-containing protein [Flavisolibacter sp.]|jgi:hypothetical protein
MESNTNDQYEEVMRECEKIFLSKAKDYGTAWRVLRTISIIDQIYIKAQRIRTIQEKGEQKVGGIGDDLRSEMIAIVNYSIIGLIQLELNENDPEELDLKTAATLFEKYFIASKKLMMSKNHDYGEAWRNMTQESFIDLITMKIQRTRQILSNEGKTIASEGIDANFYDMVNYAAFALIMSSDANVQT